MEEFMQFESEITENNLLKMDAPKEQSSYIKVLGVGGAGTNAVNHMFNSGIKDVDFIVCNTDQPSLDASPVSTKIKIGEGGLGVGNEPEKAREAAEAAEEEIKSCLSHNTRMLFITAGMGGGTGTGASPVIARFAKEIKIETTEEKILVVGVVTLPFSFEGRKRKTQAQEGILKLREQVDAIITINTDKLREFGNFTMKRAFAIADDILLTAAKGISEMMTKSDTVRVDFRDVKSVMEKSGVALMGTGVAEGENRAMEAIQAATTSKLLNDNDISATKKALLYFQSSEEHEIRMEEIDTITQYLEQITNTEVDLIWGTGTDNTLGEKLSITLVATGFDSQEIFSPVVRDTKELNPIPTPQKPPQIPTTPINVIEPPYIKDSAEISVKPQTEDEVKQPENEGIQIIKHEFTIGEATETPAPPKPAEDTKFTGMIKGPATAVLPTPEIPTQIEQPKEPEPTTNINDLIGAGNNKKFTIEEKEARIRMIRELMNSEAGINQLISTPTAEMDAIITKQMYSETGRTSNYSVNGSGTIVMSSLPSIYADAD